MTLVVIVGLGLPPISPWFMSQRVILKVSITATLAHNGSPIPHSLIHTVLGMSRDAGQSIVLYHVDGFLSNA